jgi:hypothetical protein
MTITTSYDTIVEEGHQRFKGCDSCYARILEVCRTLFLAKNRAYGQAWEVMLFSSLLDMILVKTWRIRSLSLHKEKLFESITDSLLDIINYAILAIIRLRSQPTQEDFPEDLLFVILTSAVTALSVMHHKEVAPMTGG